MRLLITAGPTREPIDAVRFISNRSSGRLGLALADAAADRGHEVTLLLGPVLIPTTLEDRMSLHRFETTADLQTLLGEYFPACETLVMAAAVADYRPLQTSPGKTERSQGLRIELEPTPDLVAGLATLKQPDQHTVSFALEQPDQLESRAIEKMRRKRVDATIANPLTTMDDERIHPVWLTAAGDRLAPGPMAKTRFAPWLLDQLETLNAAAHSSEANGYSVSQE